VVSVKLYDLLLLPLLKPVIPRYLAVMIVVLPVPLAPRVELTHPDPETTYKNPSLELPLVPVADEVHHLVTAVRFNPAGF
jgi:hypothetical protein